MPKDELERPRFQTLNAYDSTHHEGTGVLITPLSFPCLAALPDHGCGIQPK